jgi:GNAT superfamily N-acetyltransferase
MNLEFQNDIWDEHDEQQDCSLTAHEGPVYDENDKPIKKNIYGILEYNIYNNEVTIAMIRVRKDMQRKGIATAMYEKLKCLYPEMKIKHTLTTDEGSEWRKSIKENIMKITRTELKQLILETINEQLGTSTTVEKPLKKFLNYQAIWKRANANMKQSRGHYGEIGAAHDYKVGKLFIQLAKEVCQETYGVWPLTKNEEHEIASMYKREHRTEGFYNYIASSEKELSNALEEILYEKL